MSAKRILIMAGGTGGHVFPGLAVASLLQANEWQVHWLGTAQRMEADLVPQHGFDISFIDVQGVRGNGLIRLIKAPFKLIKALLQARRVIKQFEPDVILGMGGFASGPGGIAAWLMRIPLVLHEQNAVAGITNKILAKIATKVMVAFETALPGVAKQVVGNPVRADILKLAAEPKPKYESNDSHERPLHLLVVGGSLGARVLNEILPQMLPLLANPRSIEIKHQVGKGNSSQVIAAYQGDDKAEVSDFIDDMAAAYRWADLVVCRAGALTVSEIAVLGLPAIFVPLPYAVDDHQTKNAQQLTEIGAAKILAQNKMTPAVLASLVDELNQRDKLDSMALSGRILGTNDACQQVAVACATLAGVSANDLNNLLVTTEVK
jgi:UDP-N-acetylglucosamine--N-acetylmuramyl-(pentapeptide) pyrophosphoryl-undecaprenol N-acetylglucosamine transferase